MEIKNKTIIEKLKDKGGKEVTRPSEIVKEVKEFYKDLYKKEETDKNFRQHFLAKIDNKLNIQDRNSLEGLIKNEEVLREGNHQELMDWGRNFI
jgi:hypothetical protein